MNILNSQIRQSVHWEVALFPFGKSIDFLDQSCVREFLLELFLANSSKYFFFIQIILELAVEFIET